MSRQKTRWGARNIFLLLAVSYVCFFFIPVIISLLTTSGAFVLAHAPFYVLTLVLALVPTFACRAMFVEAVPEKRLGVLVNQGDTFKALLLPGNYFIMPGRERIKELLTLEPASIQLPVMGLRASDSEIAPLVVIFSWRVQDTILSALAGAYAQQVQDMIVGGQRKMEQEARIRLEAALRRCVARYSVSKLEALLADRVHALFEQEVQQETNILLDPLGLEVEHVELIGLITPRSGASSGGKASAAASEAQQTLAAAYKKLAPLLRFQADVTPRQVSESAWNAYEALLGVRKTVNTLNLALQAYSTLLLDTLDAITKQRQNTPDQQAIFQARQRTSEALNTLQATIGSLGKLLIDLELQAKLMKAPPFTLTSDEIERLLEVLAAIEQKKLTLENVYP